MKPLWKLICPRDNWRQPVEFPGEALPAMKAAADRLGLVRSVDEKGRKLYLDKPTKADPHAGGGDLTEHFSLEEFRCTDGTPVPDEFRPRVLALAKALEKLRDKVGPLVITSGYRSPIYNASIGGASDSQHTHGRAADIYAPQLEKAQGTEAMVRAIVAAARSIPEFKGIGVNYPNFVHVDIRPGSRVEW